ncbi:hypothetical protein [Streptomyces sp. V3I7]|uniref:hypothetical protein n=1 Tax=Streptomyces sp. V3I7 TaxID=3042278 RepID=UPI00277FCB9B|nr:hypothetical protein [Streptomyces sp. V3I7]MDQ0992882.1 hypothetical protein [Streptomyces sp. V3I7]
MSRETDTPSSGPNGRGGAAEDRKTETTLTTRVRINIPGSRPIPPVVVRTPVADGESPDDAAGTGTGRRAAQSEAAASAADAPAPSPAPAEEQVSGWFAPRKGGAPKGGGSNGAGMPGGSAAGGGAPKSAGPSGAGRSGPRPGGARPGGVVGSMSAPGASRPGGPGAPGGTNGSGLPGGATGGPVAPGHGGGTGSFDVTEALSAGPRPGGARPGPTGGADARRDDLPYFSENDRNPRGGSGVPGGPGGKGGPGAPGGFSGAGGHSGPTGPKGPAGPTSGPVTGDSPMAPPIGVGPGSGGPQSGEPFPGPGAPKKGPAVGVGPGGGLSDDTAILTPQKLAPEPPPGVPGTPGYTPPANISGHTVTSGIPVVPSATGSPFAGAGGGASYTPPKLPDPGSQSGPQGKQKKKKGRSKLVLIAVGVVVLVGGVYGAGLLMNHSDVPKGTTVLGVDIGGGTRDEAVNKLDNAFGRQVNLPLKLSVAGKTVALKPDQAGLQFDMQATVDVAAKSDYNPITVVGSLFGNHREVDPNMPIDKEKLQAALQAAGGGSGSVTEGTIAFQGGKAIAVYGKPGKGVDAAKATTAIGQAYRTLLETGTSTPVVVPTTLQQPTVSNAEVDRELKAVAAPAMSNIAIVQTDAAHSIKFGARSLPKILGFKAIDGKLVETYDLKALQAAYGTTFQGVQIEGATGKRAVMPQDVVGALRQALRGTTPAQRVGVIDTTPS